MSKLDRVVAAALSGAAFYIVVSLAGASAQAEAEKAVLPTRI